MSMFCYDNQIFQKDERADNTHRIFKDCSKIERLIFGYRIDSCPLRRALLSLLVEDFPL